MTKVQKKDAGRKVRQKVVKDSPAKKRKVRADEDDLDAMLARLDKESAPAGDTKATGEEEGEED